MQTPTNRPALTFIVDVFLAREPDAGVKLSEQEPVIPGLPAVHHFVGVRFVHAVVYALVRPQLAAFGLGHPLRPHAPVSGDEGSDGEEQGEEVQADRQEGPRLHCPLEGCTSLSSISGARGTKKFMGARWKRRTSAPSEETDTKQKATKNCPRRGYISNTELKLETK